MSEAKELLAKAGVEKGSQPAKDEGKMEVVQKAINDIRIAVKGMGLDKGDINKIDALIKEIKMIALT